MLNNDILRGVRYMLDLPDGKLVHIIGQAGLAVDANDVAAWLQREDEPGYRDCPDQALAHFLDGLIVHLRGRDESRPPQPVARRVGNNLVLKKLRVAFELRDDDLHAILATAGFPLSKPELSALFRKPGHPNYRPCGDQLLRHFLRGLTQRLRS
ncbi:MAG: DUF1456 family protein [Rhodanobacter sp.]|nr:MAG: DUF1456 family protein [Rhodanobacter sp.]TAM13937.1 MAG: DUF1456 family protein [Rhodanobacter sp.]TAM37779.1 MAG: DUF1456 family protein [Rhodanobacter sp.]